MKEPIAITGVWCRKAGTHEASHRIEVLVEVDGVWRLIQSNLIPRIEVEISHITEPGGMASAPVDPLTSPGGIEA